MERLATNQLSKNYKPFLWCRLRAKLFVTGLLNCTEDVPSIRLCARNELCEIAIQRMS
jgi:hypothetical protein